MTDEDRDDYLWTGVAQGGEDEAEAELAALERALSELRWQARPLALAVESSAGSPRPVGGAPASGQPPVAEVIELGEGGRARGPMRRPGLVTGVIAAAAVFAVVWLGPRTQTPNSSEEANPAGSPVLEDPFSRGEPSSFPPPTEVSPALEDPFASSGEGDGPLDEDGKSSTRAGARRVSPDLKDPFADHAAAPPPPSAPAEDTGRRRVSPNLHDPFAPQGQRAPELDAGKGEDREDGGAKEQPTLTDPFSGQPKPVDPNSPDLKDPFADGGDEDGGADGGGREAGEG